MPATWQSPRGCAASGGPRWLPPACARAWICALPSVAEFCQLSSEPASSLNLRQKRSFVQNCLAFQAHTSDRSDGRRARHQGEKITTAFTINEQNDIVAFATATTLAPLDSFTSEQELADLAGSGPASSVWATARAEGGSAREAQGPAEGQGWPKTAPWARLGRGSRGRIPLVRRRPKRPRAPKQPKRLARCEGSKRAQVVAFVVRDRVRRCDCAALAGPFGQCRLLIVDATRECRCTPGQIQLYLNKISGLLLDRIDILGTSRQFLSRNCAAMPWSPPRVRFAPRVEQARRIQQARGFYNVRVPARLLQKLSALDDARRTHPGDGRAPHGILGPRATGF
jgi:hypothetical protein